MHLRALAIALVLTLPVEAALTASPAFAADDDRAMALDLFEQGRVLFKRGSFAAALTQFEAAAKVMRTFGILLNIAECQEKLGRTASAWTTWSEARAVASEAQRPEDERIASEKLRGLEAGLSRLTIVVPPDVDGPDLDVRRDGTVIPRESWNRAIPVDPGPHIIEAHAPGRSSRTLTVVVQGNADNHSVTLTALEAAPAPPSTPAPLPVPAVVLRDGGALGGGAASDACGSLRTIPATDAPARGAGTSSADSAEARVSPGSVVATSNAEGCDRVGGSACPAKGRIASPNSPTLA
jgi:hypothetical protein